MRKNSLVLLISLLFWSLAVRILPLGFPFFTSDEARIATRGYSLTTSGRDELGRPFPLIFNSTDDYQLPVLSYLTALGEIFFGKSDFGARIPFIFLGVGLVFLIYKIAQQLSLKKEACVLAALVTSFSPALIFLSKTPNEPILLTVLMTLLFYLLIKDKLSIKLISIIIFISLFSSKLSWFIVAPYVLFTLFIFPINFPKKTKYKLMLTCILISLLAFTLFFQIPQGKRSLLENNFSIFLDPSIKNGVDRLRGESIEAQIPPLLGRVLFNKMHIAFAGFLNWSSQLRPSIFFGEFNQSGVWGFINSGALQKILIIPFLAGTIYIIKSKIKKYVSLLFYPIILTFPFVFISSNNVTLITLTLPFVILVTALGFYKMRGSISKLIIGVVVFEFFLNILSTDANIKAADKFRPSWIREVVSDGLKIASKREAFFSDDLTEDFSPLIQWYSDSQISTDYKSITFPYKVQPSKFEEVKIIGSSNILYRCEFEKSKYFFSSKRDLKRIKEELYLKDAEIVKNVYRDSLNNEKGYLIESTICIH